MIKEKIEALIFKQKSKDQLIEDTLTSLSGLLADAFTGDDVNQLKKELPQGIQIENIGVQLKEVSIYLESKNFPVPCIEVAIDLVLENIESEIGTYSLIYDVNCEQIEEVLNLY